MMRPWLPAAVFAIALLAAVPAAAQDGCTESSPCPWVLYVDGDGFYGTETDYNGTVGDWIQITVANDDLDDTHTVTLEDYDLEWTLDPFEDAQSEPFELVLEGESLATDSPSGDTAVLRVSEGDPLVEAEQSGSSTAAGDGDQGTPAPGVLATLALVGAAVAVRRRLH